MPAPSPSLFDRLKQARLGRVLLVYLGASWIALQLVDVLVGLLTLPDWVGPLAVVLLLVGLVVVSATAWVQSLPSTAAAEKAGEVPTDWEVAAGDAVGSLMAGRLPHLTWGRAIVAGAVSLSLLLGAAGLFVVVQGGPVLVGPAEVGAEGAPSAVAVLPFQTRGAGLELYAEGMVDLLTTNLEGLGGLRTINAGTVVARWRSEVGETAVAELDRALQVAGGLNARYAVRGSVVAAGDQVRLVAEVFDLADGSRVDGAQSEGSSAQMLELVDVLTVRLAAVFVGGVEGRIDRDLTLSTPSLPALEAYLRGEAAYRESLFAEANEAFADAVAADSLFALAWWRLGESWGWIDPGDPRGLGAINTALSLEGRLPARERLIVEADRGLSVGSNAPVAALRNYLRRHPDDAEAWNSLAEYTVHAPWLSMSPPEELSEATSRAVELMPTFGPYYLHWVSSALAEGDGQAFQEALDLMSRSGADQGLGPAWEQAWSFYWGSPEEMVGAARFFRLGSVVQKNLLSLVPLLGDGAARSLAGLSIFPEEVLLGSVPFAVSAVAVSAGHGPERWVHPATDRETGYLFWGLLVGVDESVRSALASAVERGPLIAEAIAAAVLAASVGDDTLREAALTALPESSWTGAYGQFGGAATPEEARRSAQAVSLMRIGEAQRAIDLLAESLAQPSYDALTPYLMGEAQAAAGAWSEAIRYWETLLRTSYRPHVRLRLGEAYENNGDTTAAIESYRGFLAMWQEGDPALPPAVEATEALARLGG